MANKTISMRVVKQIEKNELGSSKKLIVSELVMSRNTVYGYLNKSDVHSTSTQSSRKVTLLEFFPSGNYRYCEKK